MRVALGTTWPDRCGVAEYAQNLVRYMPQHEFKILHDRTDSGILRDSADCQVVHLLYAPGLFSITPTGLQSWGKPVVATYFNANSWNGHGDTITNACQCVIVHTREVSGGKFRYIPMGIPEGFVACNVPDGVVGTIGFAFGWKRMDMLAEAATAAGMKFMAIVPDHPWFRRDESLRGQSDILAKAPDAELRTAWLSLEDVQVHLGKCSVLSFAFANDNGGGISSSVRYGLATGRPCVLTRYPMYNDLYAYDDELHFIDPPPTVETLAAAYKEAVLSSKHPDRVIRDMGWCKVAVEYDAVYKEIAGCA